MENSLSSIRHAARGCFNGIKLCVSALELPCTCQEQTEFVDDVIRGADRMNGLMDQLMETIDQPGNSHPAGI
jgi:hypothetical protein